VEVGGSALVTGGRAGASDRADRRPSWRTSGFKTTAGMRNPADGNRSRRIWSMAQSRLQRWTLPIRARSTYLENLRVLVQQHAGDLDVGNIFRRRARSTIATGADAWLCGDDYFVGTVAVTRRSHSRASGRANGPAVRLQHSPSSSDPGERAVVFFRLPGHESGCFGVR